MTQSPQPLWLFLTWLLIPACSTVLNADFDGLTPAGTAGSSSGSAAAGDASVSSQGGSAGAGAGSNVSGAGQANFAGASASGGTAPAGGAGASGGGVGGSIEMGGAGGRVSSGGGGASSMGGAGGAAGHGGVSGGGTAGTSGTSGAGGAGGYVSPVGVVLNELKGQGSGPDYIELYNRTDASLDIAGCYVSDDSNNRVTFPAGATIAGTSFVLVRLQQSTSTGMVTSCLGYTPCYDGISWGISSNGEAVSLRDAKGTLLDELTYPDQNGANGLQDGQALGRVPDGSTNVAAILVSPGAANNAAN